MKTLLTQTASESAPSKADDSKPPRIALFIGGNDQIEWRIDLVPGLGKRSVLPIHTETFDYVGPLIFPTGRENSDYEYVRNFAIANNRAAIDKADLISAYITETDYLGALGQVAYAIAKGKRVVMAFEPGIDVDEYWHFTLQSAAVYESVRPCCLKDILADEIRKASTPIRRRRVP